MLPGGGAQIRTPKTPPLGVTAINSCSVVTDPKFLVRSEGSKSIYGFFLQLGGWNKKDADITEDLVSISASKMGTY